MITPEMIPDEAVEAGARAALHSEYEGAGHAEYLWSTISAPRQEQWRRNIRLAIAAALAAWIDGRQGKRGFGCWNLDDPDDETAPNFPVLILRLSNIINGSTQ